MKKIYLSGPMTGIPNFNFPAFDAVANYYRNLGFEVFNPAEKDRERLGNVFHVRDGDPKKVKGFNLREALALDCEWICKHADKVVLLPGWEKSKGALAEKALAHALGLEVAEHIDEWKKQNG